MASNEITESLNNQHKNFEQFIAIIHDFSIKVNSLSHEKDVFWLITKELAPKLELSDFVIYEVNKPSKTLTQAAAAGDKINSTDEIQNKLVLNFGEGHVGLCYDIKETIIIDDVAKSKDYIKDIAAAYSEIVVPMLIEDEVVAVISSESPVKSFYNESHRKLIEVIAIIAAGAIQRIQENKGLNKVKEQLEEIVHQKSTDLDRVIETLSNQYSELKYQHEKMELLIQEVHHRVNNNLQVISSLLSLYSADASGHEKATLMGLMNRVQAMALIHQNIYKSVEMSVADVEAYVRDLMNHLRSVDDTGVKCIFEFSSDVRFVNLNTLVPLGLLLVEIFSQWMELCKSQGFHSVLYTIHLGKNEQDEFQLLIQDNISLDLNFTGLLEQDCIPSILISALIDQLEGSLFCEFEGHNQMRVVFVEL